MKKKKYTIKLISIVWIEYYNFSLKNYLVLKNNIAAIAYEQWKSK